jgi:SAM-dependent methyltransferase
MDWEKVRYFFRAAISIPRRDFSCPFCRSAQTRLVVRKALVTSLWECHDCGLRFRIPKENEAAASAYYQTRYHAGFTTDCPSDQELQRLMATGFAHTEKDFSRVTAILQCLGLSPGEAVLDYGCSWGYGSWQLRQAGFRVYSYDVSRPRAEFAQSKLRCHVVPHPEAVPEKVKCFFSSHVVEHLPDPNKIWQAAQQVLAPGGKFVCLCPNGEPSLEAIYGKRRYHQLWGAPHPLLLTRKALDNMARRYGFTPYVFSSPFSTDQIRDLQESETLSGSELLLVALRP